MKLNNFWQRLLTGIAFVGIISAAVVWSPLTCIALFLLINIFCQNELYSHFKISKLFRIAGIVAGAYIFLTVSLYASGLLPASAILLAFPMIFLMIMPVIFLHDRNFVSEAGVMLFGLMYITVPLSLFIFSAFLSEFYMYNHSFLLAALVLTWVNDTMAYVSGSLIGKHKFYERLSPKKTWEGVIGGLIFTSAFSYVFYWFYPEIGWIHWLVLAIIVSVFAIIGDLFESRLKRSLNIKDSGNVFPGHGGFLDRFDALLFVIPFYFIYLFFVIY